jgi:hypothetical protein
VNAINTDHNGSSRELNKQIMKFQKQSQIAELSLYLATGHRLTGEGRRTDGDE